MGISVAQLNLLARARVKGVSFDRSIVIGRQRLYLEPNLLKRDRGRLERLLGQETWPAVAAALGEPEGYFEPLFRALGAVETDSLDYSAYEKANVIQDLNSEIPPSLRERYSLVAEIGCLEHVFDFATALRSCLQMVSRGGHFIGFTPINNWCGHGFYQFSPELLYRALSRDNGFEIRDVILVDSLPERIRYFRIPDPDRLRRRVTIRSSTPLSMCVIAQRTEVREIFATPPLQSDYAAVWADQDKTHRDHVVAARVGDPAVSRRSLMLGLLPGRALVFMRRLRDLVRDPLSHNADLEPLDVFEV